MTQPPDFTTASQSALDQYNQATEGLNNANAAIQSLGPRPSDAGQAAQWDTEYARLNKVVEQSSTQAAQAAKTYSDILTKQAESDARSSDPTLQARAQLESAHADYYSSRADSLSAKDAATAKAAEDRAAAALQRANTAQSRVDAQNQLTAAQTQTQGAQQANLAANTAKTEAETANLRTPEQEQALKIQQIYAQAKAQADAAIQQKQALVDQGIDLTDKDKMELQSQLEQIAADAQAQRTEAEKQFENQLPPTPEQQAQLGIQQQQANTQAQQVAQTGQYQQQDLALRQATTGADVLKAQAAAGQQAIDTGVKAGVAPPMALVQMAYGPLYAAQSLIRNAVQAGQLPASAVPVPKAPSPVASPATAQAPMPAPAAPAALDPFAQSDLPEGRSVLPVGAY